jgi:hypothetical protein
MVASLAREYYSSLACASDSTFAKKFADADE